MIKRLCIYLIYDADRIVDEYIGVALRELKRFSDKLVVVCNFNHIEIGEKYITDYADEIFYRENEGYDAGGYKQTLEEFITWEKVYEYDELLLSNDSWFGPIYPFDEMMNKMQREDCDYWGVTKYCGEDKILFPTHIQSYFLNFKFKVLHSKEFAEFWKYYKCSNDKFETIERFEVGINIFLRNKGFEGKAFMDLFDLPFTKKQHTIFYLQNTYELVRDIRMPMIKKAIIDFDKSSYVNAAKALEYIKFKTEYDYSLIENYENRMNCLHRITYFDFKTMEKFLQVHDKIYFYGNGVWGKKLAEYFVYKEWKFEGYVVTKMENKDTVDNVKPLSEIDIKENDGIIIAQKNKKVCDDILVSLSGKISLSNVLTPVYCGF